MVPSHSIEIWMRTGWDELCFGIGMGRKRGCDGTGISWQWDRMGRDFLRMGWDGMGPKKWMGWDGTRNFGQWDGMGWDKFFWEWDEMLTNFECTVLKSNLFGFARYYVSVYWAGTNSEFFLRTLFIFGLKSITHTDTHTKSWVSEQTPNPPPPKKIPISPPQKKVSLVHNRTYPHAHKAY